MTAAASSSERATQDRVIALFTQSLDYTFLGNWADRPGNSNIEEELLTGYLKTAGYTPAQIGMAVHKFRSEAHNNQGRGLYESNKAIYTLLRYGVDVQTHAGQPHVKVHLIDWQHPDRNHFAIAEEVTLRGNLERRPDLVLYINGIAIGVIELKNSRVSVGEGIRQNLSNQKPEFHAWFFATVQFVFAGNDSEGLRYGTIGTPEKYFLQWKEDEQDNAGSKLDKYLAKICAKDRILELMHDFVLFDGGTKKLPRVHQYFGIKAAQARVRRRQGGIIWHTQGSGKSIVMVLLARWILENNPHARVAVITDRDELDKQIEGVFQGASEHMVRAQSGQELMHKLGDPRHRLFCSLVHKFGIKDDEKDFDTFIKDLAANPVPVAGEIFVFVDECHRTQSGKLNKAMKAIMPNAIFIGFTGTPLLKEDKATTLETFGSYIHTYKFCEAVEDKVVLDLTYEARDIDQELVSQDKVDAWFDAKTRGLNNWQKARLKEEWGTMQCLLSSRDRMQRVVNDIIFDFATRPRLSDERGNAILVASSIYDACKYHELFQSTPLRGKCAIVTSYIPLARDVSKEETGGNTDTGPQFIYGTYTKLLKDVPAKAGMTPSECYEEDAKARFIKEPAGMKLLIVVDKLLTGFDAPPCTYLYIDKSMQDHGLFQAICRTNRLDGDDKTVGYIVDYKDLFRKVEDAISVYSSELDDSSGGAAPDVLLKDRLSRGRERLDDALETLDILCEPVPAPQTELEHIRHFCGNTEIADDLEAHAPQREALYKGTVALLRAYAQIADDLEAAGYEPRQIARIESKIKHYTELRETIRKASGETLDTKAYEADMRHLLDTYVKAAEPRAIAPFGNRGLLEIITDMQDIAKAVGQELPALSGRKDAVAEVIENNVRCKIKKEHLNDPAFYARMSTLLDEIIADRKRKAIAYEEYLRRIADLIGKVQAGHDIDTPEPLRRSPARRAIFNHLKARHQAAEGMQVAEGASAADIDARLLGQVQRIDEAIRLNRNDDWRGVPARERVIKRAIFEILGDQDQVERIFPVIKQQTEY